MKDAMDIRDFLSAEIRTGASFQVRVTPRASSNRIVVDISTDPPIVRVYVTTVPERGRANAAVIKLLAKALGVPKSTIEVVRGETGRLKMLRIVP